MKSIAVRIGIGITLYLSSGVIGSNSSLALSLKFSDRYELTDSNLAAKTLIAEELFLEPIIVDDNLQLTQSEQASLSDNNDSLGKFSSPQIIVTPTVSQSSPFSAQDLRNLFPNASIQPESEFTTDFSQLIETTEIANESAFNYVITDFLDWQASDLQIQIGTAESEESLLSYVSDALGNLDFSTVVSDSVGSSDVAILPQVGYGDVFSGLYNFDIDLTANPNPNTPRVANSPLPENLLVTREIASNYNLPGYISPAGSGNNLSNLLGTVPNDVELLLDTFLRGPRVNPVSDSGYTENLSTRVQSALTQVNNVSLNTAEIEIESPYQGVPTAADLYQTTKDPILQELEQRFAEERTAMDREQAALQRKLAQERQQRERRRKQQEINERRKREVSLRRQRLKQENNFRKQQKTLNN